MDDPEPRNARVDAIGSAPPSAEDEPPDQRRAELRGEIKISAPLVSLRYQPLQRLGDPATRRAAARARRDEIDNTLRIIYAVGLLLLLALMIGFADWIFYRYLRGSNWKVPASTMNVWLSATV